MVRSLVTMLVAIAVLVAAVARPPGVMAVAYDGGITFEICSDGVLRTVTVFGDGSSRDAPSSDSRPETTAICAFLAAQTAQPAPTIAFDQPSEAADPVWLAVSSDVPLPSPVRHRHPPRAPPLV